MFMLTSKHKAAMAEKDDEAFAAWNKAKTESDEWEAKFKKAVADLAATTEDRDQWRDRSMAQSVGVSELRSENELHLANVAALRPDAQKWRDSLKRSRDRKEAKKGATTRARDKRANRGGK